MKKTTLFLVILMTVGPFLYQQTVAGSEKLVSKAGSGWKYLDKKEGPQGEWTSAKFDDSQWKSGTAPLGYGEHDVKTGIAFGNDEDDKHITAFFRLKVDVKNPDSLVKVLARIRCDDGAVIYVNGKEVHRLNMRPGKITADTTATRALGPNDGGEAKYYGFLFDAAAFKGGSNIIAISVHQANAYSSDLFLDIDMHGLNKSEAEQAKKLFERSRRNRRPPAETGTTREAR